MTPRTATCQASMPFTISWSLVTHVHWVNDATQPSHPLSPLTLLLLSSIIPSIRVLSNESFLFASGNENTEASVSVLVLPMDIQGWFILWLIGLTSLQFNRLSRSSPAPQFKSINPLIFSFPYGPTFKSIHDYCKNYAFEYMHLCQQSNVSAF